MVNQGSDPGFVGDLLAYNRYVDPLLDLERGWRICDSEGLLPSISEMILKQNVILRQYKIKSSHILVLKYFEHVRSNLSNG